MTSFEQAANCYVPEPRMAYQEMSLADFATMQQVYIDAANRDNVTEADRAELSEGLQRLCEANPTTAQRFLETQALKFADRSNGHASYGN